MADRGLFPQRKILFEDLKSQGNTMEALTLYFKLSRFFIDESS